MTTFDRHEADRLLNELLDLPPEERSAAVDAACDDEVLRRGVLRLLEEVEAPDRLLARASEWTERLWSELAAEAVARETPLAAGSLVGPYRILEEIERGGMAVVYRAERVDGELTREVAVKVLKLGIDSEEVVRRFEQERQILADLDHPNIARVYDAGRTEEGRPFFVMELVEGMPIDRYCDERCLTIDERLELFCAVADAVDSAHQNLVVHRDLKPSNILVNAAGEVKLLDFGIARLLDVQADGGGAAPPTRALVRMMTPEYASPEQVRGGRVTPASDVYQLGLLLYELLSGRRAHASADQSPGDLERTICERMPTRPSAAVGLKSPISTSGDATDRDVSRARHSTPARLRRRLTGDLDNIVLHALRKEPERRYRGADQVARDVRRHLEALPVTARPDTWTYRGRKFLRRHAVGTSVAAGVLALVAGMAAFYTARVQRERDQARAEATKAEKMNELLTGLFRGADPREAHGASLTARELLDRGVAHVDGQLAGQPAIQADMFQVLGETYLELRLFDPARRLLRRSLELRRGVLGPRHPDVASVLGDLGRLRHDEGEYELARDRLWDAVEILDGSPGEHASELASDLRTLGEVYRDLGEPERSLQLLDRALRIQTSASGEDSLAVAANLYNKGALLVEMGERARAERLYVRALAIREQELGPDHPAVASILMNLATAKMYQGELDDAEAMLRRSIAIQRSAYGDDHAEVGIELNNLGDFLIVAGRLDEAIEVLLRAIDALSSPSGPDHPDVAYPLASLGDAHYAAGHAHEARDYYRRSVTVREGTPRGLHRFDALLLYAFAGLSSSEATMGNTVAADRIAERALKLWRQNPTPDNPSLAPAALFLGRWLADRRRCGEALPLLRRGLESANPKKGLWMKDIDEPKRLLAECESALPKS